MHCDDRKTFVTLFTDLENVHLIKDPGMIPYTMQHSFGFHAVVPKSSAVKYPYADDWYDVEMPEIIEKKTENKVLRTQKRLAWLKENATGIDILHLYFYSNRTLLFIKAFQSINPEGKVYVHCDSRSSRVRDYNKYHNKCEILINRVLRGRINPDNVYWGIQDSQCIDELRQESIFKNIAYVPDGYYWTKEADVNYCEKQNVVLFVGRIGAYEKNVELLVDAFNEIKDRIPGWKLVLIGPTDGNVNEWDIDGKTIIIKGETVDRDELQREYLNSKIFCLPSRYESFGISMIEAMSCGCSILCSDIESSRYMVNMSGSGSLFESENKADLKNKLFQLAQNEDEMRRNCAKACSFVRNNYSWNVICENLLFSFHNFMK